MPVLPQIKELVPFIIAERKGYGHGRAGHGVDRARSAISLERLGAEGGSTEEIDRQAKPWVPEAGSSR